jgi:hypothetical protein
LQLLENFPTFYGSGRFITMFTRAFHWSLSLLIITSYADSRFLGGKHFTDYYFIFFFLICTVHKNGNIQEKQYPLSRDPHLISDFFHYAGYAWVGNVDSTITQATSISVDIIFVYKLQY